MTRDELLTAVVEAAREYRDAQTITAMNTARDKMIAALFAIDAIDAHALALEALVLACELPGDHCEIEQALPAARAALELSHRSLAGYALVPRIPTTAMIVAAIERSDSSDNGNGLFYGAIYRAMIAAAPTTEGDGR